jgi:mRNA deadenylase 3'-5' endonuclease subunit Ccr4
MMFKVKNFKTNEMDYIFYKQPDPIEVVKHRRESHRCWETLNEEEKKQVMTARGFLTNHIPQDN